MLGLGQSPKNSVPKTSVRDMEAALWAARKTAPTSTSCPSGKEPCAAGSCLFQEESTADLQTSSEMGLTAPQDPDQGKGAHPFQGSSEGGFTDQAWSAALCLQGEGRAGGARWKPAEDLGPGLRNYSREHANHERPPCSRQQSSVRRAAHVFTPPCKALERKRQSPSPRRADSPVQERGAQTNK